MSTKTTFKRVALVAVAALGFGVLSVAPSNAAAQLDSISVSLASTTQLTSETLTATSSLVTATLAGTKGVDTLTVTASIVSGPAYVQPILAFKESTTAEIGGSGSVATVNPRDTSTVTQATGKFNVYLNAPTVVGTYVVRLTPTGGTNAVATTVTIVVSAAPADDLVVSAAMSTSILSTGETATAGQAADSATVVAKALNASAQAATIKVVLKNANGTTLANQALTVIVKSGTPGTVGSAAEGVSSGMTAQGRAITTAAGDVIGVFSDGTEGVAEVEIYVGTVLLATEKVTFFGDVASYTGTFTPKSLGVGDTATITVAGADKAGNATGAPTIFATSSDTTVATVPATSGSGAIVVTGVKSGKATITLCDTAECASAKITSTVAITVGAKTAKTVTLAFSNDAPTAGEKVTVTLTALDASGNPVADGARFLVSSAGITSSIQVSGSTLPTGETVTVSAGVATYIFYAPAAGTVTFTATEGSATDSTTKGTITGSITVSNPGLDAATDAANDATDAANAALDAALAAAEAADAAIAAAQEASDAIAALSESVTQLIAGLQAQIKSLAAVLARIAKQTAKIK